MTVGAQTRTQGKLLDYKEFIEHQIAVTRRRIKYTDLVTACLTLAVGVALVLLIEVVLDHAFGLPAFVRRIILIAGTVAAAGFVMLRMIRPLLMSINTLYAAKTIEGADPEIKNSLINYLEIRRDSARVSRNVMAALESRAVADLAHVEIEEVVDQRRAMQAAYALCGVIVAFCLYAALTPKSILDSTKRAFLADVVRPTNTKLVNIKPGDNRELAEVVAGSHVPFSVDVQGVRPGKVKLHYSADGGKFYAVKEFEPGKNYYDPWSVTLSNLQQSLDYYVSANDAESLHYELKVLPAPMVESVSLDYEFPAYTGIPPREGIEGGNVEAVEGTIVTVHARTNEPAKAGSLNLTAGASAAMTVSEADAHAISGKFKVEKPGTYTINFRTTGGQLNPNPVVYDISALPDRQPAARFVRPERSGVKVPANVPVDLVMTGDDDHGVKDATLHVMLGDESLVTKNVLEGRPPMKSFEAAETLDLEQLKVPAGSTLTYWLAVRDNREPTSNRIETPRWTLDVGEPVAPQEKQEIEQRQAEERERREREARENQPPPPADQPPQQDPTAQPDQQPSEPGDQDEQGESRPEGDAPRQGRGENARGAQPGDADREDPNAPASEDGQPGDADRDPGQAPDPAETLRRLKETLEKRQEKGPDQPQGQQPNQGAPGDGQPNAGDRPDAPPQGQRPRTQQPDAAPGANPNQPQPPRQPGDNDPAAEVNPGQRDQNPPQPDNNSDQQQGQAGDQQKGQQGQGQGQQGQAGDQPKGQQGQPGQGQQGEQGQGQGQQGQQPGGGQGGANPVGGGGRPDGGGPGQAAPQEEEPIDPIREPEDASGDTVAPRNQDQSELVLRTIRDLLDKNADTSDLEAATGMSRTEMDQFVKQYEKLKSEPAGPGREIEVEPGESGESARATPGLPGLGERARSSSKAIKERGGMAQDEVRGNQEGLRFAPPPEFRGKVEGYKNALSRRPAPARAPAPQPPAGGGTR